MPNYLGMDEKFHPTLCGVCDLIISNVLFKHTRRPYSNHISRFYMYDIYRITCFFTNMTVCVTEQIT